MQESKNTTRGLECERLAILWYQSRNYKVCAVRYSTPFAEVDLLLEKDNKLFLIEVKSLTNELWLESRVSAKQKKRLRNALLWIESTTQKIVISELCVVSKTGKIDVFENFLS